VWVQSVADAALLAGNVGREPYVETHCAESRLPA